MPNLSKYSSKCYRFISQHTPLGFSFDEPINTEFTDCMFDIIKDNRSNLPEFHGTFVSQIERKGNELLVFQLLKALHRVNKVKLFISPLSEPELREIDRIVTENDQEGFISFYEIHTRDINIGRARSENITEIQNIYLQMDSNPEIGKLLYDNPFISLDIHHFAETSILKHYIYRDTNTTINLFIDVNHDRPNMNNIMHICRFMRDLSKKRNPLLLNILYSPKKKKLPTGKTFMPANVNSGSALTGVFINLWRKEELHKVLIHELIHYFEIDFVHPIYRSKIAQDYTKKLHNTYRICGDDRIGEAYTEALAIIIHCSYIAYMLGFKKEEIRHLLELEINFSLFQMAKILKHSDIETVAKLKRDDDSPICLKQDTSVFSYYIIKVSLLVMFNDFIEFVQNYNHNNGMSCGKSSDKFWDDYISEYIELIGRALENKKMITRAQVYLKILYSGKANYRTSATRDERDEDISWMALSTRMSSCEINLHTPY